MTRLPTIFLIAVLIAGLGVGGYLFLQHRQKAATDKVTDNVNAVLRMGARIKYGTNRPTGPVTEVNLAGSFRLSREGLEALGQLTDLKELNLSGTNVTEDDLALLKGLTRLEVLYLSTTSIGDAGVRHVAALTHLKELSLDDCKVTDAGLAPLAGLKKLTDLYLNTPAITDAGLKHLHGLPALERLYLNGTGVTEAGVSELKKALPKLEVYR